MQLKVLCRQYRIYAKSNTRFVHRSNLHSVSCEGFPLTIQVFSGKDHDNQHFIDRMKDIKVKTHGRPRTRPQEILADAAYDNIYIRKHLSSRGIQSNIPVNIRNTEKRKGEDLQDSIQKLMLKEER